MTPQEVYEKWTAIGWFLIVTGIYFVLDVAKWIKTQLPIIFISIIMMSCASGIRINGIRINGIQVRSHQVRKIRSTDIAVVAGMVVLGYHIGHTNNLNKKP